MTTTGRYGLASTPEERLAIAAVEAIRRYEKENPQWVNPGYGFFAHYLKPFLDREILEARLDEIHKRNSVLSGRERELLDALMATRHKCETRILGQET